jgi:hypothetical protein
MQVLQVQYKRELRELQVSQELRKKELQVREQYKHLLRLLHYLQLVVYY